MPGQQLAVDLDAAGTPSRAPGSIEHMNGEFDTSKEEATRLGFYEIFAAGASVVGDNRHINVNVRVTGLTGVRQQNLFSFAGGLSSITNQRASGTCTLWWRSRAFWTLSQPRTFRLRTSESLSFFEGRASRTMSARR
jgi:hypothetical protein